VSQTYPFAVLGREFAGRRVLVTGGTKGVCQAIARRFLLAGAKVATTARSPSPGNQDGVIFIQADLSTAAGAEGVIQRLNAEWGIERH
jgi:NAD(P)-dependent dehydrogenase (short-subunit alcohol dehydrogenase family)